MDLINRLRRVGVHSLMVAALWGLLARTTVGQETTGGLQGMIKDSSGALVSNAHIEVTGTTLVGSKAVDTDSSGYFRFANLPPGTYLITVAAKGFRTEKQGNVVIETGHLPSLTVTLQVGAASEVIEVTGAAPVIDVTTNTNQTNVTSDVLADVPHGYSFQSVIQFAPMARNEPLAGLSMNGQAMGGTGGALPGSSGNGNQFGYSVGGAADSESSYLVEGMDTENISGGYSKANVPFQFIQEVQIKSSGIEAEHGGALGGVVNVVMKKGSNAYHGSMFASYESSGADANPTNPFLRYDPLGIGSGRIDPGAQSYIPSKDHFRIAQPGFTAGGPIVRDRLWFFLGFAPQYNSLGKTVNFGTNDNGSGKQYFTQDLQQYYGTARIDATLTQRIRLFGSWLYQYARETGASLPISDPVNWQQSAGYLNTSTLSPLGLFSHGIGFSAPDSAYNVGADISLSSKIVSTTRFGYFFENYRDFGWPTSTPNLQWSTNGAPTVNSGGPTVYICDNSSAAPSQACPTGGNPLPSGLQQARGTTTTPYDQSYTLFNSDKHYQFNEDVAFFKSGWAGTHNIKIGYQLNHLVNVISQNGNVPLALLNVGRTQSHGPITTTGTSNCTALTAAWGFVLASTDI